MDWYVRIRHLYKNLSLITFISYIISILFKH
jgi:hypothetical protein